MFIIVERSLVCRKHTDMINILSLQWEQNTFLFVCLWVNMVELYCRLLQP